MEIVSCKLEHDAAYAFRDRLERNGPFNRARSWSSGKSRRQKVQTAGEIEIKVPYESCAFRSLNLSSRSGWCQGEPTAASTNGRTDEG
jgi:hypothetical protein